MNQTREENAAELAHEETRPRFKCVSCGQTFNKEELKAVEDPAQLPVGSQMPGGECPSCGDYCYSDDDEEVREPYEGNTYSAEIDFVEPETPCRGCGCDSMPFSKLKPIYDCTLTPGDPSPAGRCPECEGLVYVDTAETRARDKAETSAQLVREILDLFDQDPNLEFLKTDAFIALRESGRKIVEYVDGTETG